MPVITDETLIDFTNATTFEIKTEIYSRIEKQKELFRMGYLAGVFNKEIFDGFMSFISNERETEIVSRILANADKKKYTIEEYSDLFAEYFVF